MTTITRKSNYFNFRHMKKKVGRLISYQLLPLKLMKNSMSRKVGYFYRFEIEPIIQAISLSIPRLKSIFFIVELLGSKYINVNSLNKSKLDYYLKEIGMGSGRIAYSILSKAIKIAMDDGGIAQNRNDFVVYNLASKEEKKLLPKLYYSTHDYRILIVERVRPVNLMSESISERVWNKIWNKYMSLTHKNERELLDNMISKFELSESDILRRESWGVDRRGKYKILDTGLTDEIYDKYYSYW